MDAVSLGIALISGGIVLYFLLRVILSGTSSAQVVDNGQQIQEIIDSTETPQQQPMIVIQSGGKLKYVNSAARELFQVPRTMTLTYNQITRKVRPLEAFQNLCLQPGKGEFMVEGKFLRATSYLVPLKPSNLMVIIFDMGFSSGDEGEGQISFSFQSLQFLQGLGKIISSNQDFDDVIKEVLTILDDNISGDDFELCIWEQGDDCLLPYRIKGMPGEMRLLDKGKAFPLNEESLIGKVAKSKQTIFIPDTTAADISTAMILDKKSFHSIIGLPLLVGEELVGTIEVSSQLPQSYTRNDLEMLQLMAEQVALTLHAAKLRQQESLLSKKLSEIQYFGDTFKGSIETQAFYAHLIQTIRPFSETEILGFLIYNGNRQILQAQNPFIGLPPQFVDLMQVKIEAHGEAEQILLKQKEVFTQNASESSEWQQLGLIHLAQAASLRETLLIPLVSRSHMLGFLLASNHRDGRISFNEGEIQLLELAAGLASPVIENLLLSQQNQQRVQRSDTLRRIAALTSSSAPFDYVLRISIQELSFLYQAEMACLFLVSGARHILHAHLESAFLEGIPDRAFPSLSVEDVQFPFTVTGSLHTILENDVEIDHALIPFYQNVLKSKGFRSAIISPLVANDEGLGELWLCSTIPEHFDQSDVQFVSTVVLSLAGFIQRHQLAAETDEKLHQRVEQLDRLRRVSLELSTSTNLGNLLQIIYDQMLKATTADAGTVLLFDPKQTQKGNYEWVTQVGDTRDYPLSAFEIGVIEKGEPLLLRDSHASEVWKPDRDLKSVLLSPVCFQEKRIGLVMLFSRDAYKFDDFSIETTQALASQIAVSSGTYNQYEEEVQKSQLLSRQLSATQKLVEVSQKIRPNYPLVDNLKIIGEGILEAARCQSVSISIFDPVMRNMRVISMTGSQTENIEEAANRIKSWQDVQTLLRPEDRMVSLRGVPEGKTERAKSLLPVSQVFAPKGGGKDANFWENILLVPLYNANSSPLGIIFAEPEDKTQKDDPISTFHLELFGVQAALIIEGNRYIQALLTNLSELEAGQGKIQQSIGQMQKQIPGLLRKDFEQNLLIHNLQRKLIWQQAIGEIIRNVQSNQEIPSILKSISLILLHRLNFQSALIVEKTTSLPRLLEVIGEKSVETRLESTLGQKNPLRFSLQENRVLVSEDLENDAAWKGSTLLSALNAQSFICLPFQINAEKRFGILLTRSISMERLSEEEFNILESLVEQVNGKYELISALNETRTSLEELNLLLDFSQRLTGLSPSSMLELLIEKVLQVIPAASAGWVGVWDEKTNSLRVQKARGYSDNRSMEEIAFYSISDSPEHPSLPLEAFQGYQVINVAEVHFAIQYKLESSHLLHYRKATNGNLPLSSLLAPIIRGENRMGILVIESFETTHAFTTQDEALALSLCQQTALALENLQLFMETERRSAQLEALTQVATLMTSSLDYQELIDSLLEQMRFVIPFDTATLWIRDQENLTIAASTGYTDLESRIGISVSIQDSLLFQEMIQKMAAVNVPDQRVDERFSALLEPEYLSWLGIPLLAKSELIGVIALEKKEAGFYSPEYVQAGITFAGQAAISLQNARFFEENILRTAEMQQRSQRLALLNSLSSALSTTLDVDEIIRITSQQIVEALDVSRIAAVLIDDQHQYVLTYEFPAFEALPRILPKNPLLDHLYQSLGVFSSEDIQQETESRLLLEDYFLARGTHGILMIPLETAVKLHGWFWLQTDIIRRYNPSEIELSQTICNQAAIAIQNGRLFYETNRLTNELERRVQARTAELETAHQNTQTLLRIIMELSSSLQIEDVLNRTLQILNQSLKTDQSLVLMADGTSTFYQAGEGLIDPSPRGFSFDIKPEQEIAGQVIQTRQTLVIEDVKAEKGRVFSQTENLPFGSVLASPLTLGEQTLGVLMLLRKSPSGFDQMQRELIEASARQISIAINNSALFELSRDQSERLVEMLRGQQVESSRSRAILEAVADGVLVTDSSNEITLFNASAERILDLQVSEVIGRPLENFMGLFGAAARSWFQTIRLWSIDPTSYHPGESYSERIELDNGRVVMIHLAPVFLGENFLGTVSIFRDITQEVRVDRLKSDFVANVSHELRTPMTSIMGYVELLLMGAAGLLTEQQTRFMQTIKENTQRLAGLVNDLLDISRLEAGQRPMVVQTLDIRQIAESVIDNLRSRAVEQNKSIEITLDCPDAVIPIHADMDYVRKALQNLLNNAYQYTPEQGHVRVVIRQHEESVQVDVIDDGIGISPEDHGRIFERFYRGDHPLVLASAGTGLGLAISKILIEMQGGRIWFESEGIPGRGSTFSFTLPIKQEEG